MNERENSWCTKYNYFWNASLHTTHGQVKGIVDIWHCETCFEIPITSHPSHLMIISFSLTTVGLVGYVLLAWILSCIFLRKKPKEKVFLYYGVVPILHYTKFTAYVENQFYKRKNNLTDLIVVWFIYFYLKDDRKKFSCKNDKFSIQTLICNYLIQCWDVENNNQKKVIQLQGNGKPVTVWY